MSYALLSIQYMIMLTKLNGERFFLNAIYIEQIQSFPDTTITLTSGKKHVVKEKEQVVTERVLTFYRQIAPFHLLKEEKEEQ